MLVNYLHIYLQRYLMIIIIIMREDYLFKKKVRMLKTLISTYFNLLRKTLKF